jgi:hypothetical protein
VRNKRLFTVDLSQIEHLKQHLNQDQSSALNEVLFNDGVIKIQGSPGTGKVSVKLMINSDSFHRLLVKMLNARRSKKNRNVWAYKPLCYSST